MSPPDARAQRKDLQAKGWAAAIAAVLVPLACLTAPPAEGYRIEGPRAGPTRMPPDGYRWELAGRCRQEMRRNVYQPGVSVPAEVCDFELVPEHPTPSASR